MKFKLFRRRGAVAEGRATGTGGEVKNRKLVNLALQGGGSHGAFTWGVLDRLLEDGRLEIEGISGTSAGAMNAVALVDGLERNGVKGARESLFGFWRQVSEWARFSAVKRTPLDVLTGNWTLDASPGYLFFDILNKFASPYTLNPLNLNPLRDFLRQSIDFDRVRSGKSPVVFISCTNVETGRVKVFPRELISADVVMASACLPFVFQAVEIDGVPYWDGGYMGNPVLFPFHGSTKTRDYVIVQINPIVRRGTPKTAREIMNRVSEISFNSSLLQELRAIDFVHRLIDEGKLSPTRYKRVNIHIISASEELSALGAPTKFNGEWEFLQHLFEIGRQKADDWLSKSYDLLGVEASANTRDMYYGEGTDPRRRYIGRLR